MINRFITLSLFVFLLFTSSLKAVEPSWIKQLAGTNNVHGYSVTTDKDANIIVSGTFKGTVDFNPGTAQYLLTASNYTEYFVCKFSSNGDFLWAKNFEVLYGFDTYRPWLNFVQTDINNNVYLAGSILGKVDFDPDTTEYIINTHNSGITYSDFAFICCLDENGKFKWVRNPEQVDLKGTYTSVNSFEIDAAGNFYLAGEIHGTVDFLFGNGTYNLSSNKMTSGDSYICKYNSNLILVWAKQLKAKRVSAWISSLKVSQDESIYISGAFNNDTIDFDPGKEEYIVTKAGQTAYILKLNKDGEFEWVRTIEGNSIKANELTCDSDNNVYITGSYFFDVDFNPSEEIRLTTAIANTDIYLLKLDTDGKFVWVNSMGGRRYESGASICTDKDNNILITGRFDAEIDLDPSENEYNLDTEYDNNLFIGRYSVDGEFLGAAQINANIEEEWASTIFAGSDGSIYLTGKFPGTMYFNNLGITEELTSKGNDDAFVCKIATSTITGNSSLSSNNLSINMYPNPCNGQLHIQVSEPFQNLNVEIYSLNGKLISSQAFEKNEPLLLNLYGNSALYIVKITIDNLLHYQKLVLNQ